MIILFCISMFILLGLTVYVCILHDDLKNAGKPKTGMGSNDKVDHGPVAQESVDAPVKGNDEA